MKALGYLIENPSIEQAKGRLKKQSWAAYLNKNGSL